MCVKDIDFDPVSTIFKLDYVIQFFLHFIIVMFTISEPGKQTVGSTWHMLSRSTNTLEKVKLYFYYDNYSTP